MTKKQYIIKKYVISKSVKEALLLEKKACVDEVLLDLDWKSSNQEIGFVKTKK